MTKHKPTVEWVDPNTLTPNTWNPNHVSPENEEKLANSMERLGTIRPVVIRELPDGTREILGGEHRVIIARRNGEEVMALNVGAVDDERAKEISLADNQRYGTDNLPELALVLDSLDEQAILDFMPFTDAEFNSILAAGDVDVDNLLKENEIEQKDEKPAAPPVPTHQIMRFKIAIEDAHKITDLIEHTIRSEGLDESDALTNAGDALVHLLVSDRKE